MEEDNEDDMVTNQAGSAAEVDESTGPPAKRQRTFDDQASGDAAAADDPMELISQRHRVFDDQVNALVQSLHRPQYPTGLGGARSAAQSPPPTRGAFDASGQVVVGPPTNLSQQQVRALAAAVGNNPPREPFRGRILGTDSEIWQYTSGIHVPEYYEDEQRRIIQEVMLPVHTEIVLQFTGQSCLWEIQYEYEIQASEVIALPQSQWLVGLTNKGITIRPIDPLPKDAIGYGFAMPNSAKPQFVVGISPRVFAVCTCEENCRILLIKFNQAADMTFSYQNIRVFVGVKGIVCGLTTETVTSPEGSRQLLVATTRSPLSKIIWDVPVEEDWPALNERCKQFFHGELAHQPRPPAPMYIEPLIVIPGFPQDKQHGPERDVSMFPDGRIVSRTHHSLYFWNMMGPDPTRMVVPEQAGPVRRVFVGKDRVVALFRHVKPFMDDAIEFNSRPPYSDLEKGPRRHTVPGEITCMCETPDGLLALGTKEGYIYLSWGVEFGDQRDVGYPGSALAIAEDVGHIVSMATTSDGRLIVQTCNSERMEEHLLVLCQKK